MIDVSVVIRTLREGTPAEQQDLANQLEAIADQIRAQREKDGPLMGAEHRFGELLQNL